MAEPRDDFADENVQGGTRAEEKRDATAAHVADRPPTPEEEAAAEENQLDPEVAEHEREMTRLGREAKGEGRIE
jgi:hypothetical protein